MPCRGCSALHGVNTNFKKVVKEMLSVIRGAQTVANDTIFSYYILLLLCGKKLKDHVYI